MATRFTVEYDITHADLISTGFTHDTAVLPERYRFIDCGAFLTQERLRIVSSESLSKVSNYSTISYVWNGLKPFKNAISKEFTIIGIEDAHPVNLDLLSHACQLSLLEGCPFIWLDLICIQQGNLIDKSWQVLQMRQIYGQGKVCIVLPGGLQRLARPLMKENTPWASRHWTLQEASLPERVLCLYSWGRLGSGFLKYRLEEATHEIRVTKLNGVCAFSDIDQMLGETAAETSERAHFMSDDQQETTISSILLASVITSSPLARQKADWLRMVRLRDEQDWRRAIWLMLFTRTSKYPIDAVLSTMHLLNAPMDPRQFQNQSNARLKATIRLMQAHLNSGGFAHWLEFTCIIGLHFYTAVARGERFRFDHRMCTIPYCPESEGMESPEYSIHMEEGFALNRLTCRLGGSMDDRGYLRLTLRSFEVDRDRYLSLSSIHESMDRTSLRLVSEKVTNVEIGLHFRSLGGRMTICFCLDHHERFDGDIGWHVVCVLEVRNFAAESRRYTGSDPETKVFSIGGPDQSWC